MEITPITYGNQKNIVRVPRGDDTLLMYEDYQEFPLAIVMGGIPEDGQLPTTGEVEKTNWADAGLVESAAEHEVNPQGVPPTAPVQSSNASSSISCCWSGG